MTGPTSAQLLILADRAERGPLTPAEAERLRAGIRTLVADRRAASGRLAYARRQLNAVSRMVHRAQARGDRGVPLWVLAQVIARPDSPPQRPPVATGSLTTKEIA